MRYTAAEKLEIIQLVEQSSLLGRRRGVADEAAISAASRGSTENLRQQDEQPGVQVMKPCSFRVKVKMRRSSSATRGSYSFLMFSGTGDLGGVIILKLSTRGAS